MKKKVLIITILLVIVSTFPAFMADTVDYAQQAEILKGLGLFSGTNNGFELDRAPKRVEAAAMLVKFLGKEDEAKSMKYAHPFTDVPAWADHLIGYMYHNGLTTGIGNNLFGSDKLAGAKDYTVFVLKALGYDMTDFDYTDTMNFAVSKGLISSDEKSKLEGATFKRDEMVFLSYNALFTNTKGSEQTLGAKLGKSDIEVVKEPVYTTITRNLSSDGGSFNYIIDKNTLPAPFNEFVYFSSGNVWWSLSTDDSIINYLVPGLKDNNLNENNVYSTENGFGKRDNAICIFFDSDKKVIGYFDVKDVATVGKIKVELKEVKPYVFKLNEIKTGITMNSKAEINIDRSLLPDSAKNYKTARIATLQPTSDVNIEIMGKTLMYNPIYKKSYSDEPMPVLGEENYFKDKVYVYLYDAENKILGYAWVNAKPALDYCAKSLETRGIIDVTDGFAYRNIEETNDVTGFMIPSEVKMENIYTFSLTTVTMEANPILVAYYKSLKVNKNLWIYTSDGITSVMKDFVEYVPVALFYDKVGNLVGYHTIKDDEINGRPELFVDLTVNFVNPLDALSNGSFNIEIYEDGVKTGTVTGNGIMIKPFGDISRPANRFDGVIIPKVFKEPNKNIEFKVISLDPNIVIKY